MRILDSSLFKTDSGQAEKTRRTKEESRSASSSESGAPAGPGRQDTVATGNQKSLVSQALQADEVGRKGRVEQLKSEFDSGSYRVDPVELSRSIIADATVSEK